MGCHNSNKSNTNKPSENLSLRIKSTQKENNKSKIIETKIVLLGDVSVGKTSIASRYCKNLFNDNHITTIGAAYQSQKVVLQNGATVKFHIWDTTGQDLFKAVIKPSYYKGSNCLILIYDIEDLNSFLNIKKVMNAIREYNAMNKYKVLVGNKCESLKRLITEEEGKKLADEYNMDFFEISAKEDKNNNFTYNFEWKNI